MEQLSIFTTMTNPDKRMDPWKEALECYEYFTDNVVIVGKDWPQEFSFELIGEIFQQGFDKSNGDWVIRMDIDYFFHEKDKEKLINSLNKYPDQPALAFPQYQFFTPERYQIKTRLCLAINKKKFPQIKFNGGGDLCLPTLNNKVIEPVNVKNVNIPVYQYDSMFRTKEIIKEDRARFARAWHRRFGEYSDRGGPEPEEAYEAWLNMITVKYKKHTLKTTINKHPKFIQKKLKNLSPDQFGFNGFGLEDVTSRKLIDSLKGYKEKYYNQHFKLL
tara:strand:- start:36429 stop:37250 length:822 start_codon:yes stop_codon:yes gene_type:complete